jgi:hypothetical protein
LHRAGPSRNYGLFDILKKNEEALLKDQNDRNAGRAPPASARSAPGPSSASPQVLPSPEKYPKNFVFISDRNSTILGKKLGPDQLHLHLRLLPRLKVHLRASRRSQKNLKKLHQSRAK